MIIHIETDKHYGTALCSADDSALCGINDYNPISYKNYLKEWRPFEPTCEACILLAMANPENIRDYSKLINTTLETLSKDFIKK